MKAIVTGASSGIGLAIAKTLSKEGWQIASASRDLEKSIVLTETLNSLQPQGKEALVIHSDLSNESGQKKFIEEIKEHWTCPDLIICNAGVYVTDLPSEITREKLLEQLEINVFQAIRIVNEWLPAIKERGKGTIIFTGSIINIYPRTSAASYTLSKNLLDGYARLLFDELKNTSIKITRIQPGSVNTPSFDTEVAPIESFVKPEDIASAVSWILKLPETTQIEELIIRPTNKNW